MWTGTRGRPHRSGRARLVVLTGLAGFVAGVYVVVVRGGGALVGRTDSPSTVLSVLATVIVALGFAPAQAALRRATGLGPAVHHDVLGRFAGTVPDGEPDEDLPARMAMLLAQGTGASWAQVWLTVADRLTPVATWPAGAPADPRPPDPRPGALDDTGPGRRAATVRQGGRLLGVLRLQERPGLPLTSLEERLFTGLAARAGLVLRQAGLRAELAARHAELAARAAELDASRDRLIATQDAERRRLERDIHDGAQQHLVALAVNLRLAETVWTRSPDRAARVLADQATAVLTAIEQLSRLSRGIYPHLLAGQGLPAALRAAVAAGPVPVTVDPGSTGRFPAPVESAFYFCCTEAIQNAAKHSGAAGVTVLLAEDGDRWLLTVTDDGSGFDAPAARASGAGSGLANMADRVDALGGTVAVDSAPGAGTTIRAAIPRPAV